MSLIDQFIKQMSRVRRTREARAEGLAVVSGRSAYLRSRQSRRVNGERSRSEDPVRVYGALLRSSSQRAAPSSFMTTEIFYDKLQRRRKRKPSWAKGGATRPSEIRRAG